MVVVVVVFFVIFLGDCSIFYGDFETEAVLLKRDA